MKLAIMQPYLFPYIGYFQLIDAVDRFIIYDDVNYINRGWINRNRILINGKASYFTIPLNKASQNRLISEISILERELWRKKFLRTIELTYGKAPQFNNVFPLIEEITAFPTDNLADFLVKTLELMTDFLGIKTELVRSSTLYDKRLKGAERIIDICKQEKASAYINAPGGIELYDKNEFAKHSIDLKFIEPDIIVYSQFNDEFISHLSIIDILMFNSSESTKKMIKAYTLQ